MTTQEHGVDTVTEDEKEQMVELLEEIGEPISARDVYLEHGYDSLRRVVSILHALLGDDVVTHNIEREYYLIE